jgi:ferritin-like metal-binding protein YciE
MAQTKQLDELFHEGLKDIYFAEKKILTALPKLAKAAQSKELVDAFEKHRTETEEHVARLEQVFKLIKQEPHGKTCPAIMGLVEEGQEIAEEYKDSARCGAARGRAGGRALRDRPLRHVAHLGAGARPQGRGQHPVENAR